MDKSDTVSLELNTYILYLQNKRFVYLGHQGLKTGVGYNRKKASKSEKDKKKGGGGGRGGGAQHCTKSFN